jgi:hypothetical protein
MKSIKEKAKEYGLLNPDIHYDADGNTYDDVDKPSVDFEAGANYVIEQIEKQLDEFSNFEDSLIVRRLIEELKKK